MDGFDDSGQLLADVIESIEDGAAIYDADDRLVQFNQQYAQYFTLIIDILKPGISFRQMFEAQAERGLYGGPASGKQAWVDARVKLFGDGARANEFQRVDGRWVRIDYYKLPSGGTFVVTADITKRKEGEAALELSNERLEHMVAARTADLQAANDSLREVQARLNDAIESIDEGFIYYDADEHLVLCNARYREFYPWIDDVLVPGARLEDVARAAAERGQDATPIADVDEWVRDRRASFASGQHYEQHLRDGRWLSCSESRTSDGGFVGLRTDITARKQAEDATREANERFYRSFAANPAAIAIADLDGKLHDVNNKWIETFGYTADEAIGKKAVDLGIWLDPADRDQAIAAHSATGLLENHEVTFRARDGRLIHGLHSSEQIEIDGRPMRLGITSDITKRKYAEEALREREVLFARVFQSSPALLAISRPRDGAHFDVNKAWIETTGYSHKEAMARSAEELGIWSEKDVRDRFVARLVKEGSVRNYPAKFHAKDGRDIDVIVAGEYMDFRDEPRLLVAAHDITERKRVEDALRESEERLKSIIENSSSAIFLKDLNGRYLLANSMFKEWYGISNTEVVGQTSHDIFPSDLAERVVGMDTKVLENDFAYETELEVPFADGSVRWVHVTKFPVRDAANRTVGVGTINGDVTARHNAEEQLRQAQKMEAVGQLTGGVAHDFNNLLAVIMGNAELLSVGSDGSEPKLEAIRRAATRGSELTQRLLAYSRQQPLRPQTIDLAELTGGMSDMLARTLGATVEIETRVTDGVWLASADPGQVENALLNLVINARDAMPDGGKLTIECMNVTLDAAYVAENPEAVAGDFAVVAVSDSGTGMSEDVRAHAFDPFFTTKEVGEGSGLGLSMVYGFTKQSGGHVSIYSEEGQGTTVKIYLPRAESIATDAALEVGGSIPMGQGETILIIEDDEDVRILASQVLEGLGYRVVAVPEAASARAVLKTERDVSLVLSDVVLPGGMSGPDFAEEARTTDPDVKIIFMSGYPAAAAKRNGFMGSDRVLLNKPFQRRELAEAVREALAS